ncbi:MAG: DNA translocase FtsK 4TM domain-containing protein, partial [Pseudomonadota bacterium]
MSKKTKKTDELRKEPSPIRKEIRGILFLLLAVILGVSLFSYDPGDPVFGISTGHSGAVHNLFGTLGAHLSGWIFRILGFSSYWLVVFFLSMTAISFRGNRPLSPVKSTAAAFFMIGSFAGLLSLQFPERVPYRGRAVLSGGIAGDVLSDFMKGFLNPFGAYVLLLAIFIIAFMYCTRLSFGQILMNIS